MFKPLASLLFLSLLACSAESKEPPKSSPITVEKISIEQAGGFFCQAKSAQRYVGQKADAQLGQTIINVTGAKVLRWIPPGGAISQDYRTFRVNISYDDNYIITNIRCG